MFELPLSQAIGANKPGKNEVAINFVDPGQRAPDGINPKTTDELMDITFYVPGTVPKEENADGNTDEDDGEELNADAVSQLLKIDGDMMCMPVLSFWTQVFYENVKSKLELGQLTSENIVQFQEVLCLTPRYVPNWDHSMDMVCSWKHLLISFHLVAATISTCSKTSSAFVESRTITRLCTAAS
jgi:structure-specific recognition protein 1